MNEGQGTGDSPEWEIRALSLFFVAVTSLWVLGCSSSWWFDHLLIADATAYPLVAWHLAQEGWASYDGLTFTNGFHPLWMLLQAPLMFGAKAAMERLFLVKALAVITTLGAAWVWKRVAEVYLRSSRAGWILFAWLGASGWTLFVLMSGMETPLVLFFMGTSQLLAAPFLLPEEGSSLGLRTVVLLGLSMGLCFLARLDSVFYLLPLAALLLPALARRGLGWVASWAGAGLCVSLPYLAANWIYFGGLTPVSGVVKTYAVASPRRGMEILSFALGLIQKLLPGALKGGFPFLVLVGILVGLGGYGLLVGKLSHRRLGHPLVLVPVAATLQFLYYFLYIRELLVPWHLYLQVLSVYLVLAATPDLLGEVFHGHSGAWARKLGLMALLLLLPVTAGYWKMKSRRFKDRTCSLQAAEWSRSLPVGTRCAMYDGWYAQLLVSPRVHLLDLSGLVSDRESAELVRKKDWAGMLERNQIEFVMGFERFLRKIPDLEIRQRIEAPWSHKVESFWLARRKSQR
jgi:hypothetical protein